MSRVEADNQNRASQDTRTEGQDATARALHDEITQHERVLASQSYLQRAVASIYHPADRSLQELKTMAQVLKDNLDVSAEDVQRTISDDRKNLMREQKVKSLAAGALTIAPLFIPGPLGLAGSAALNALNTAVPDDTLKQQSADLVLGAVKGVALKGIFAGSGVLPGGYLTQSLVLGPTQNVLESTLNTHNYQEPATGEFSLSSGLSRAYKTAFDPYTLGASLISTTVAGKAIGVAGRLAGSELIQSPLSRALSTGALYGFAGGIADDVKNSYQGRQSFDFGRAMTQGLERAAIGAMVAAPGGLIASRINAKEQSNQGGLNFMHKVDLPGTGQRQFTVRLPANYDATSGSVAPTCIVALHGCFMDANAMARVTGLGERAKNAIVVYPEGKPLMGDSRYRIWGGVPVLDRLVGTSVQSDSQYLSAVSKFMRDNYHTDPARTYIIGYSAGGNLAVQFALANPGEVSAVSAVSSALPGTLPGRGEHNLPSILQINARHDRVIPVTGRDSQLFPVLPRRLAYQSLRQIYGINSPNKVDRGDGVAIMSSGDGNSKLRQILVTAPVGQGTIGRALGHEFLEPGVMPARPSFSAMSETFKFFEGR